MNLKTSLNNLISDEDNKLLHEIKQLAPPLKNRWFAMGRDVDRLIKLLEQFGKPKEVANVVEPNSSDSVSRSKVV